MSKYRKSYFERFMAMTDAQRAAEVARFDEEYVGVPGVPLTAAEKALHRRAKRRGAQQPPRAATNGEQERVSITIERRLLERADAFAKAHGTSRSRLIAEGLEAVIGRE